MSLHPAFQGTGRVTNPILLIDDGNFTKNNVGYRLRFLQKSHLPAKRVDDVLYGCVFCVHQGHTLDESDATVFFTTKALFSHLARHTRPLPDVPGICVVDQAEVPDHLRNDYDLHFTHPPTAHPAQENGSEVAGHPTGVAKEQARRIYGQRLLYDRTAALELAQGARVTGIKWPPKYNGEWIFAWHDGVFASVPTDVIRLDLPPAADIKLGGTSHIRAKSKWKFAPKDKEKGDWLKFDKNETITNISCKCFVSISRGGVELTWPRGASRALVLVGHEFQGQMGHLPSGLYRPQHGAGARR